jgi:two-component system response regulator YesN
MRSYTILIVDDEAFVVDWLSELLERQPNYDFNIYRAYNAVKAMEWIERTRIDLLITDIRMPNISGLDLVKKLNQLWPFSKSLLLSAHADFEYAQQAIQFGVVSYILKTADDNQILAEINKAINVLDTDLNQQKLISDTQKNLNDSLSQLKRQVFFHWLRGNYLNYEELIQCINTLGFTQSNNSFCILIGKLDYNIPPQSKQITETFKLFQVKTITEHYLQAYWNHYAVELNENRIIWILEPNEASQQQFLTLLTGALEIAQQSCKETIDLNVSFVVSNLSKHANDLPEAYFIGKNILNSHSSKTNYIYTYHLEDSPSKIDGDLNYQYPTLELPTSSLFSSLKKYLEGGNRQQFLSILDDICKKIGQNVNWHNNVILETYFTTIIVMISYINQRNLATKLAFKTGLGILFRPWLGNSWAEIEEQLFKVSNLLFDMQEDIKKRNSLDIIEVVKHYIEEHITEDFSLIDLADLTGYSTTYLSKFFSENEGRTISDYIAQCKIDKIKELMFDLNLNIGDISKEVGFHSRTYFNNYFKRIVGMAPQQYRDRLLLQQFESND